MPSHPNRSGSVGMIPAREKKKRSPLDGLVITCYKIPMNNTTADLDTMKKLREAIMAILPAAQIEYDPNGQVVIYSNKFADDNTGPDALSNQPEWAR